MPSAPRRALAGAGPRAQAAGAWLRRLSIRVHDREVARAVTAFLCFFCVLAGWNVLKPIREAMGISGGVRKLPWLYTGTFLGTVALVPLYSAIVARFPRRVFVPAIYRFLAVTLVLFVAVFRATRRSDPIELKYAFFVWTSTFVLYQTSVFWSLVADVFRYKEGKRLFGFIAGGASLGAIAGSLGVTLLVEAMGIVAMIVPAILLFEGAARLARRLGAFPPIVEGRAVTGRADTPPTGRDILEGFRSLFSSPYLLGILVYTIMGSLSSTFVYMEQASIVNAAVKDPARQTRLFAEINFAVQGLSLLAQAFATPWLIRRAGVGVALAVLPAVHALGFAVLGGFERAAGIAAVLAAAVSLNILRSAAGYGVTTPAREVLFTVVTREEKYKAKACTDTAGTRGADLATAWLYFGLESLRLGRGAIAFLAAPVGIAWAGLGLWLARGKRPPSSSPRPSGTKLGPLGCSRVGNRPLG